MRCSAAPRSLGRISARISAAISYEREVAFLRDIEWARSAEDILDRRTKHGLHIGQPARAALDDAFKAGSMA